MSDYKLLSVNEDNGHSDRLTARFFSYGGFNKSSDMIISVSATRKFTIEQRKPNGLTGSVEFQDIDIDGVIQYLQDVKVFLSEEDMVKKLMGN
jgi:hypothetical protein